MHFLKYLQHQNIIEENVARLNIIDITKRSNQPYRLGAFTLVFNGEIYNYLEIKSLLVKEGGGF